jgi:hypothetical protein
MHDAFLVEESTRIAVGKVRGPDNLALTIDGIGEGITASVPKSMIV